MNKGELVERVRASADISRVQAEAAVDTVLDSVMTALQSGERVSLAGFGSFNPSARAARTGRNPQTGAPVKIAASNSVRFSPASAFKQALNPRAARKKAVGAKAPAKQPAKKAPGKKAPGKKVGAKKVSAKKLPAKKAGKSTKKR